MPSWGFTLSAADGRVPTHLLQTCAPRHGDVHAPGGLSVSDPFPAGKSGQSGEPNYDQKVHLLGRRLLAGAAQRAGWCHQLGTTMPVISALPSVLSQHTTTVAAATRLLVSHACVPASPAITI